MNQLMMAATVAAILTSVVSMQQSYAQYETGSGAASQEQLHKCADLGIDRNQCNDVTILAKERLQYSQKTTYGNNPVGSGTPYFGGAEMFVIIGILGPIFGGVALAFYLMGRKTKVPA